MSTTKEERAHLNQLVRDLVQGDANLPSVPVSTSNTASNSVAGVSSEFNEGFHQIPYICKQVLQTSKDEAFSEYLTGFILKKESEIERMCGLHYQEFVQSVDQLLKVRAGSCTVKNKIISMNDGIQGLGGRMIEKKRDIVDNRQKLLNVEVTLEAVQACLFVLDISNRIQIQITNKKYFSALRMIEELQSTHLKLIRGYSFCKMIATWLPQVQDAVRESVLKDLKEWFLSIKKGAPRIGKLALGLTTMRQEKANEIVNAKTATNKSSINQAQSMDLIITEEFEITGLDTESAELDFTAIFQCIHIHEVLGKRIQLKLEFDESRRMQAEAILHSPILALQVNDLSSLEKYIQEIAGFFVIEATIISTTHDFRSRTSVEMLWSSCTNKMNAHLFDALTECTNPDLYLNIKMLVSAFISTMEIYGYPVNSLADLMVSLLDRYAELMKNRHSALIFKVINEDDDYSPMVVRDADELDEINNAFNIPDEVLKQNLGKRDTHSIFPRTLLFSKGLPLACVGVKEMIHGFYKFADGFTQQNHEIDDLLKKTLETLLQGVNAEYNGKILSSGISVVNQLMINLSFFETACEQFEAILMEKRYSARTMRSPLLAGKLFAESRLAAEHRILAIIIDKNTSFLDLVDTNWKATQPQRQPSPILNDLVAYMTTVMNSTLADLPQKAKGIIYYEAFDHIATTIKNNILGPGVSFISLYALETVEYNVLFLEKACTKLSESHGQDSFAELRQLIAYGRSEKYEEFAQQSVKNKKYSRVNAEDAITLLEKLNNFGTSWFTSTLTAQEKQLKQNVENALKLIKQ